MKLQFASVYQRLLQQRCFHISTACARCQSINTLREGEVFQKHPTLQSLLLRACLLKLGQQLISVTLSLKDWLRCIFIGCVSSSAADMSIVLWHLLLCADYSSWGQLDASRVCACVRSCTIKGAMGRISWHGHYLCWTAQYLSLIVLFCHSLCLCCYAHTDDELWMLWPSWDFFMQRTHIICTTHTAQMHTSQPPFDMLLGTVSALLSINREMNLSSAVLLCFIFRPLILQ